MSQRSIQESERQAKALCQKGIALCELEGNIEAAYPVFHQARSLAADLPEVASWLGYTMALVDRRLLEGWRLCKQALESPRPDAYYYRNLAVVTALMGQRQAALGLLAKGYHHFPNHRGLEKAWARLGLRQPPLLPFLPRRHPLNVWGR